MFAVNTEDNSIYVTRGDILFFSVQANDNGTAHIFQPGDIVRMNVTEKKACENVVLQKDFPIATATDTVEIILTEKDTKIGETISKAKDYWYEVVLNPETNPQTIIGYDDDGPKIFKLFPEGDGVAEGEDEEVITPEDIPFIDDELDVLSDRPVRNKAIARAVERLNGAIQSNKENANKEIATALASEFKTDENTWSSAINNAINSISAGKVIIPAGVYECDSPIVLKSNICLEGQGIDTTVLRFDGCHGITCAETEYLRFASVKDITLCGGNGGNNGKYDNTKNGIHLKTSVETYQCSIENVRIIEFAGKGLYVPYDFNNFYRRVFVSKCGGNGIEICGLNTCTLENCYVEYVGKGYCGYRIYGDAVLISCNGLGGGGDYWGIFGRDNGKFEDENKGVRQHNITFINCNIEDFAVSGCKFLYSGGFSFDNCTFYAKKEGTFDYYIEAADVIKPSLLERVLFESKGATSEKAARIKCTTNTSKILSFNKAIKTFTIDGTTVYNMPYLEFGVYDSYLQQAIELGYANIQGMSYFNLGGNKHSTADYEPTTGTHAVGEIVYKKNVFSGGYIGWVCVEAGTPGKWKTFGAIS
jgi:hypothetical protein